MPIPVSLLELAEVGTAHQMWTQASQHKPAENLGTVDMFEIGLKFAGDELSSQGFFNSGNS